MMSRLIIPENDEHKKGSLHIPGGLPFVFLIIYDEGE
jgi:hypothetical protein